MRIVRPPTLVSIALVFLLGSVELVHAEGTCNAPNARGFERLDPDDDDSGIGGTGALPQRRARVGGDDESGIGGTGFRPPNTDEDQSGVGGTGLFGRITHVTPSAPSSTSGPSGTSGASGASHASRVCLNGVDITIPTSLNAETSDGTTSARSLAAGQLAYVEASRTDGGIVATRILLDAERAGQIEVIGKNGRMLTVSGQKLRLAPDAVSGPGIDLAAVEAGAWIRFQARPGVDETLVATRIDSGRPSLVRRGDADFEMRAANLLSERARGRHADADFYVSIEGVLRGNPERPELLGIDLGLRGQTALREARAAQSAGARVRIGGRLSSDGRLDVEAPPSWLAAPREARSLKRTDPATSLPAPPSTPAPETPETPRGDAPPDARRIKPVKPETPSKPPVRMKPTPVRPDIRRPSASKDVLRR